MMADPRIQTIGEIPVASGVGEMLFDQMEQTRQNEAKLKHAGALAGITSKHRLAEQENANKLAIGMENLRNQLAIQRSQQAFQQEVGLKQQAAQYLQSQIGQAGQQGIPMPGLTTPTMGTPEAGIPGTPSVTPIQPGSVGAAREQYSSNLAAHLRGIEQQRGLSLEVEKKQLFESMDLMTDSDARDAESLASQFEAHADGTTAKLIRSYATPGRGSKSQWQTFRSTIMPKLLTAAAGNQTRLAIAQETTSRAKEVQRLRGETQKLLALPRLDAASYKRAQAHHAALKAQHDGYNDVHKRLEARTYLELTPEAEANNRTEMRKAELKMQELQTEMQAVSVKLGGHDPAAEAALPIPAGAPVASPATSGGWGKSTRVK